MLTATILLVIAAASLAAIILTSQWALERRGIDLDSESMDVAEVSRFSPRQKTILAALLVPVALILVAVLAFLVATIVVTTLGLPVVPG